MSGAEGRRRHCRYRGIEARLFCEGTAEFTQDVIGGLGIVLWNTTAGGGDAGCASQSTLVLIVIQGPPSTYLGDVSVEGLAESFPDLAEETAPDTSCRGTTRLSRTFADGRYFVPVWLYDTGCAAIDIHAWIEGARHTMERKESIQCWRGE